MPYKLRHTFVSIAKVLPEGTVKKLFGHSASMDTFGVYRHAIKGENQQVALQLNDIFTKLIGVLRKQTDYYMGCSKSKTACKTAVLQAVFMAES